MMDGEPAGVYAQRFDATLGVTCAQIWISAKSGLVLREEIDGDITGKGIGHLSMQFSRR
jgi:hypothetical protein